MDEGTIKAIKQWNEELAACPAIPLWPKSGTPRFNAAYGQLEPTIVPYLPENGKEPRGAVIVCAGGSYMCKVSHEGHPNARMLNAAGINAFLLDYRVIPYTIDCALLDAQRAIRTIRHRSAEWGVNPEKIGILGFSAGGHLAIMASTQFDYGDPQAEDPVERFSSRPDAQIPCYPLVSFQPILQINHEKEWIESCFGGDSTIETIKIASGDKNVRKDTPPAFLWGTFEDFLIDQWPPYLKALKRKKVPYEHHLFPYGQHGLGLAAEMPLASQWPGLCAAWLKNLGF
jgi:acetyl esterase/lipase